MNWIRRIFGRTPPAPPQAPPTIVDRRHMNEDWKVGDLAVCISSAFFPQAPYHPKEGDLLRVAFVHEAVAIGTNLLVIGLGFVGKPPNCSWVCLSFRKVRPEAKEADEEFVADIKQRARRGARKTVKA